jgi:hypothetical protein
MLIEPELELCRELCVHGYVDRERHLLGSICEQQVDIHGSVTNITQVRNLEPTFECNLKEAARTSALALRAVGYFGPFGIDARVWRDGSADRLDPSSELNARFTVGWSTGMGELRSDALRAYAACAEQT